MPVHVEHLEDAALFVERLALFWNATQGFHDIARERLVLSYARFIAHPKLHSHLRASVHCVVINGLSSAHACIASRRDSR
jgi:hypothetical protein